MSLLHRLDRAQLAAADAAVEWLWRECGVPRRMLLRMALVGQFLTQGASEFLTEGRVQVPTLVVGALVMGLYHLGELRFGSQPSPQRAITLARRSTDRSAIVRAIVWLIATVNLVTIGASPVLPIEALSVVFFIVFMIGGDALPPDGPRKPRRRSTFRRVAGVAAPASVRGFRWRFRLCPVAKAGLQVFGGWLCAFGVSDGPKAAADAIARPMRRQR